MKQLCDDLRHFAIQVRQIGYSLNGGVVERECLDLSEQMLAAIEKAEARMAGQPHRWLHVQRITRFGIALEAISRDKTQQAILDELSAGHLAVTELAERRDVSGRQIRRAVDALADRGLVDLYKVTHQLPNGGFAPVKLFAEKRSHLRS